MIIGGPANGGGRPITCASMACAAFKIAFTAALIREITDSAALPATIAAFAIARIAERTEMPALLTAILRLDATRIALLAAILGVETMMLAPT